MESFSGTTQHEPCPLARTSQLDALQEKHQLGGTDLDTARTARQAKGPFLQTLVPETVARTIPVQDLHSVSLPVAEDKQVPRQRGLVEQLLGACRQAVERAPQVDGDRCHEHPHRRRRHQHDLSSRTESSRRNDSVSNPGPSRTDQPRGRTTSNPEPSCTAPATAEPAAGQRTSVHLNDSEFPSAESMRAAVLPAPAEARS